MPSKIEQNRLAIKLACECLKKNGFTDIHPNRPQGTYPNAHINAIRNGNRYFIGVTSRQEFRADGTPNPGYNLVRTANDLKKARRLARKCHTVPAFVAVALRCENGLYSAYFGTLESIDHRREVPMKSEDRRRYEVLADRVHDLRVAALM